MNAWCELRQNVALRRNVNDVSKRNGAKISFHFPTMNFEKTSMQWHFYVQQLPTNNHNVTNLSIPVGNCRLTIIPTADNPDSHNRQVDPD